jgi:hypothetical protein
MRGSRDTLEQTYRVAVGFGNAKAGSIGVASTAVLAALLVAVVALADEPRVQFQVLSRPEFRSSKPKHVASLFVDHIEEDRLQLLSGDREPHVLVILADRPEGLRTGRSAAPQATSFCGNPAASTRTANSPPANGCAVSSAPVSPLRALVIYRVTPLSRPRWDTSGSGTVRQREISVKRQPARHRH